MEPFIPRLFYQAVPRASRASLQQASRNRRRVRVDNTGLHFHGPQLRYFSAVPPRTFPKAPDRSDTPESGEIRGEASYAQPSFTLSQDVTKEEKNHYNKVLEHSKEQQIKSPWMRAGSDIPPVARQRSAGAMTKGKLLTTPSRMLKLILPLTVKDTNKDRKDVEPLALLVHPQQPLSYLERLIQSELPLIKEGNTEKIPSVHFRAEDSSSEARVGQGADEEEEADELSDDHDAIRVDGKIEKTGKISGGSKKDTPEEEAGRDADHANFVRWSPSTEIGDFIRDASRGHEFSVEIQGAPEPIYVGVPSFKDRTYYLRMRLRKTARRIAQMADIKLECDHLARRGAQRFAQMGFAGLIGWWYIVYRLTFETDLGWDVMEPVTYLVGLSTFIGGYMWFLYHNREVSYKSAMSFTISRRQTKLYEQRGFDLPTWEGLVDEGNRLRREIKMIAEEYDVEWDEKSEEGNEKVSEALRKERQKKKKGKDDDDDQDLEDQDKEKDRKKGKKGDGD